VLYIKAVDLKRPTYKPHQTRCIVSSPLDKVKAFGQSQGHSTKVKPISFPPIFFFLKIGVFRFRLLFSFFKFLRRFEKGCWGHVSTQSPRTYIAGIAGMCCLRGEEKKKRPDGETARRRGSEIGEIEWEDDMTAHLGIKSWMTI